MRNGFLLQKELALPVVNITLAEFLYRGKFSSDKNILHHQTVDDSIKIYNRKQSRKQGKKVTFGGDLEDEKKKVREIKINFSELIKSTFFSVSFKEMSLVKCD